MHTPALTIFPCDEPNKNFRDKDATPQRGKCCNAVIYNDGYIWTPC